MMNGTLQTIETRINNRILPFLGEQRLNAIKVPQLRKYLSEMSERYGAATIIESWGTLSSILQAAVDDEMDGEFARPERVPPPVRTP